MNAQDYFNQNAGMINALGHVKAIEQRNRQIAQQREHAVAISKQTAQLEIANRIEADRFEVETQRLEIERQRQKAQEAELAIQREQAEQVKQLRNLMADSFFMLEQLRKTRPVC